MTTHPMHPMHPMHQAPPTLPAGALTTADWRPGRSRQGLDRRIELASPAPGVVAVRSVVAPAGPYLVFDQSSWTAFLRA